MEENIIQDYVNLVNIQTIKNKYKVSYTTIKKICIENNVWNQEIRTIYKRKHCKDHLKDVKINPFSNLSDENVNYWLGMLAADGNIQGNTITLSLKSTDEDHVIKFKNFCKSNLKVIRKKDKRYINYYMSTFRFNCVETSDFLKNIGIVENKTKVLDIHIPITWDFVRGVIDGDGHIYFNNKGKKTQCYISLISASKIFIEKIKAFYKVNNIKCRLYSYNNLYTLQVTNFINCKKLINFLYNNADTFLERKYLKAQLISNYQLKTELKLRELA